MPSPNDLTTLSDVKTWTGISSTNDDLVLAALITELSVAILSDLGRGSILPAVYTEVHDGGSERSILLRQWPVAQLLSVTASGISLAIGSPPFSSGQSALSAFADAPDPAPPGRLQRVSLFGGLFPDGIQNISVSYRAGYEISAEKTTIPAAPPYTVTVQQPFGIWQADGGVTYANGQALTPSPTLVSGTYSSAGGVYTFSAGDAGAAIILRYGYIPADLARACREWAAERYAYRARIGQSSKSLGGQETTAFIVKEMPDFVSRRLQPYRRVINP